MAANSKGRAIACSFGKRIAKQIWAPSKSKDPIPSSLRVARYSSSYDKNLEEEVRPAVVPDYAIKSDSDKYWGPNPKTGVFGPADPSATGGDHSVGLRGALSSSADGGSSTSSVLDQTAWFRPLEDVEKPPPLA